MGTPSAGPHVAQDPCGGSTQLKVRRCSGLRSASPHGNRSSERWALPFCLAHNPTLRVGKGAGGCSCAVQLS